MRHRLFWIRQHRLGALNAALGMVSVRRHPERLLECSTKMIRTQLRHVRQLGERTLLVQIFFDEFCDGAPLLASKAAARAWPANRLCGGLHKFVGENDAQSVET